MDDIRFDRLTRRFVLSGLGGGSLATFLGLVEADAKKRAKKVKRNDFGCVNVGNFCKNDDQCCSGICRGKKGRKKCRAHDATTCQPGQADPDCGGETVLCVSSAGKANGVCQTTTGNAGYCSFSQSCRPCAKDEDCQQFCGPAAACLRCLPDCAANGGTACAGPDVCGFS